mmetsp:Transcript_7408/g.12459  ORF Transcript_7408/g.12459 Transcript_7408/m.12459 type:complete len:132 (+) Transcript_7408:33-428(+)
MSSPIIDLTGDKVASVPSSSSSAKTSAKKRSIPGSDVIPKTTNKTTSKKAKKECPHALLWICGAGKGQGRVWKQKALKVVGIYKSKEAAERKREDVVEQNGGYCGHGDIVVGPTWEDEIDLVVRPVGEMDL